jgi:hypothetical protein
VRDERIGAVAETEPVRIAPGKVPAAVAEGGESIVESQALFAGDNRGRFSRERGIAKMRDTVGDFGLEHPFEQGEFAIVGLQEPCRYQKDPKIPHRDSLSVQKRSSEQ